MDRHLTQILDDLAHFGATNDATVSAGGGERGRRMLNITPDTGEFLAVLVRATQARRVLEIGTSNGYSTLWLADAARGIGGAVTTVEAEPHKVLLAADNFRRAGLADSITQVEGDAGAALDAMATAAYDLVFLDSARDRYEAWWPALRRVLRPGGLLVVDNAVSHAAQMAAFCALVRDDPAFTTALVPVGKGEFLATANA